VRRLPRKSMKKLLVRPGGRLKLESRLFSISRLSISVRFVGKLSSARLLSLSPRKPNPLKPAGRLRLVNRFPARFNSTRLTRSLGSVRLVSWQDLSSSRLRLVNPSGNKQVLSALKLSSTVARFVNVNGTDSSSKRLDWRSSETRLRA